MASTSSSASTSAFPSSSSGGISEVVTGVTGAVVTLVVVFGLEVLIMSLGGLRLVSKKRLAAEAGSLAGRVVVNPKP